MKNFINLNTQADTITITSEMKKFISKEIAEYMYYINSQTLDNDFFNYQLEKITLNIAHTNLNAIDAIYSKIKVNSDGTINSNSITTDDLQLLNNIIKNDNSALVTTEAINLLELINIYKKF